VVIKASSHTQIDALIRDLASSLDVKRDAAVARLTVIGARAVERLTRLSGDPASAPAARAAALRALEAIGDPRAIDAGLQAADDADEGIAAAGIAVARALLQTRRSADVVDHLTALALDRARPRATRAAAIRALGDLRKATVAPLLNTLRRDPDAEIAALASMLKGPSGPGDKAWLLKTVEGAMPDDPARIQRALSQWGGELSLPNLHRLVQRLREREASEPSSGRTEWAAARAAAHAALAARGSRIALYDLRETLEASTEPLPVEFLTALAEIGDETCLEAMAQAYAKARSKRGNDWWRDHLADAFRAIVGREKITKRNAAMKKIEKRWPQAMRGLGLKA
jgi:HEAT repeat protein